MTAKNVICGIDPGLDGAIALLSPHDLIIADMPTHLIRNKRKLDLYGLARFFDTHASSIVLACIEDPGAMPGQGVSSMFKFGFNCGAVQMAVAACLIPVRLAQPATWKRHMGLTHDKDATRKRASEMLPKWSHLWPLAKHDGRAESVLLAIYGSKLV